MSIKSNEFMERAACSAESAELFFLEGMELVAKKICRSCVVRVPCLEYGLAIEQGGVFGNTSEADRRELIA